MGHWNGHCLENSRRVPEKRFSQGFFNLGNFFPIQNWGEQRKFTADFLTHEGGQKHEKFSSGLGASLFNNVWTVGSETPLFLQEKVGLPFGKNLHRRFLGETSF